MRRNTIKKIVRVSETIRSLFLLVVIRIIAVFPSSEENKRKKRVLLIRLDAIGDFILWLDAAKALRTFYPTKEYEITLVGNQAWTSLASELPYFDRVWPLQIFKYLRNPFYCCRLLGRIRREGFAIAINSGYSREFQLGDVMVNVSKAPERIAPRGETANIGNWQKKISDRWYTKLVPSSDKPMMELERNAEFVRGIGIKEFQASIPVLPVTKPLPDNFTLKDYYVVFPGAGSSGRQWPLLNFRALIERIYKKTGLTGIICGGPGEEHLGVELEKQSKVPLANWVNKTSLAEFTAIAAKARFLVGNETSAIHIAAAVSTPAVCTLGGGHFGRFMPYPAHLGKGRPLPHAVYCTMDCFNCNWECIYRVKNDQAFPCISAITVDDVWEAVRKILETQSQKAR